jgi:Zn-dependent protease with chaperone function
MQGAYYDGLTSRRHAVEVTVEDGQVVGVGDGVSFHWPLNGLRLIEAKDGKVRLAPHSGDGRLVLDAADWEVASRTSIDAVRRRARLGEWRLVGVLAAVGVTLTLAIFVGIPMAARPLAKITPLSWETAMGRNMTSQIQLAFKPCEGDPAGLARVNDMAASLADDADMPFPIKVIPVHAPMVNAFALPGGTILVTGELIAEAKTSDELAGVIAHEIAHVEKRHVMEAVWRSLGLGLVLDAVVGGGSGAGQQAVLLASSFTEQRFSREKEAEADARAYELLAADNISTAGMAAFFERMADKTSPEEVKGAAEWFSTHPDSGRRADAARARARSGVPALTAADWEAVRRICPNSKNKPKRLWPLPR